MEAKFHNNVDALVWLDTSAEQHALISQCFQLAKIRISQALEAAKKKDFISVPIDGQEPRLIQPGANGFCVFSDLDETLLDNSVYNAWLAATGRNFCETGSWTKYCDSGISKATPGAVDFCKWLSTVRDEFDRPVHIFYVTSRLEISRKGTASSLKNVGLPTDRCFENEFIKPDQPACIYGPQMPRLFLKGTKVLPSGDAKYDQYQFVQKQLGLTPILWLGDNASDFARDYKEGGIKQPLNPDNGTYLDRLNCAQSRDKHRWGLDWIQFPNPVYGAFLNTLPKREYPDGTIRTMGDDDSANIMTDTVLRAPLQRATTPKKSVLDIWDWTGA